MRLDDCLPPFIFSRIFNQLGCGGCGCAASNAHKPHTSPFSFLVMLCCATLSLPKRFGGGKQDFRPALLSKHEMMDWRMPSKTWAWSAAEAPALVVEESPIAEQSRMGPAIPCLRKMHYRHYLSQNEDYHLYHYMQRFLPQFNLLGSHRAIRSVEVLLG